MQKKIAGIEVKDLISVVMEEWDPQKMLDLYIYDYLIRKNLHLTAETFSREAGVHPKSVAIDPPEGFLQEWWSLFWDLYSDKLRKLDQEAQPSSSKATANAGYMPQNVHPVVPMPDVSYMLQNTCPAVLRPPFPYPLQNASPPTMPSPDMGYMLQDALSAMMVRTEQSPNRFGPTLIPDINMKQEQSITNLMAATMREQDHLRPPARDLNSNSHVLTLDQLAYVLPSPSSSHAQKAVNNKRQLSLIRGANQQVRFQPRQGNLLAAASGNIISVIDVETGMIHHRFQGHAEDVRSICWDVCGTYLVSVSEDSARIWSVASGGKCVHQLQSGGNKFASCTFHPAYSQVVAVGSYQNIDIWNPTMGNKTWSYQAHQGIISALANASETNMIASVSHDQWIKLWK
ncbi:UNVERIFIED_CONTAM: Transcriptional corepressor LEUNIG [Sesamum angustifolium]|uniref:Transcriptional corepressor LEUNIG n=1 Tax=Sesamum angustifolium TaxID=2727405 RepID=A0AAW2PB22_9LAMI